MKKKGITLLVSSCMIASGLYHPSIQIYANQNNSTVIDVTKYGADASGNKDSTQAVQKAILEAKKKTQAGENVHVTITFPKGRYDFYPDRAEKRALYVSNTTGANEKFEKKSVGLLVEGFDDASDSITIDGQDSLFMYHGKMTTFASIDSKNVTFKNFDVDFEVPTVIDITAIEKKGNTVTYYIPECYNFEVKDNNIYWTSDNSPYTNTPYWKDRNGLRYQQVFQSKEGYTKRGATDPFKQDKKQSIRKVDDHKIEVTYNDASPYQVGDCYQMRQTDRDHPGTLFMHSNNITLQNLDVHFIHGFGMVGQFSDTITMDDVDFETNPARGTTTAGYADFIQMSGCKGDIEIKNSTFSNPHDDPINIHGTFLKIVGISDNRKEITVQYMHNETAGFPNFFVNDEIEFTTAQNMVTVKEGNKAVTRRIQQVDGPDGTGGKGSLHDLTKIKLTLDQPVPSGVNVNTHVVENITYTPNVKIHDNMFKETPTRGVLCTTRGKVDIYNNVFDRMGMAAIYISNDAHGWYESGPTKDVTIRENTFIVNPRTQSGAAILVEPTNNNVNGIIHSNMNILNNTFLMDTNEKVVNAKCVENLQIKGNRVYRNDANLKLNLVTNNTNIQVGHTPSLTLQTGNPVEYGTRLYRFHGCKQVELSNNVYDGGLNAGIQLDNTNTNEVHVVNDLAKVNADHRLDKDGMIQYEVSNPNVIQISSDKTTVKGIGKGTSTVKAYTVIAGRRYESNPITFTVGGESKVYPTKVEITNTEKVVSEKTLQLTKTITAEANADQSVTWRLLDPQTQQVSNKATISNDGLLTVNENGVVEVVVETANGLQDRILLVLQTKGKGLSSEISIENEQKDRWAIVQQNKIQLKASHGGTYNTQTPANVFKIPFTKQPGKNEITLKLEGKTTSAYTDAGLYVGSDFDNYVALQRKFNGEEKLSRVWEKNQSAQENVESISSRNIGDAVYFKIEMEGTRANFYHRNANATTWTKYGNEITDALTSDPTFIAFGVMDNSGANEQSIIFSELTVNGREVSLVQDGSKYDLDTTKVTIDHQDASKISILGKDKVELSVGNGGTYQNQTPKNFFKIPVNNTVSEVSLRIDGKTAQEWEDVGLYLGKDADNYVAFQRKHRQGNVEQLGVVNEKNGTVANGGEYLQTVADVSAKDTLYFKMKRNNNKVSFAYSVNGTTWTDFHQEVTNDTLTNNDLFVGFGAMKNGADTNTKFTFSELKVNNALVSFTKSAFDAQGEITNPSLTYDEKQNTVIANYTSNNSVLVKWMISEQENGPYELVKEEAGQMLLTSASMKNHYVKAVLVPISSSGVAYEYVETSPVRITGSGSTLKDGMLADASLKSGTMSGFDVNISKRSQFFIANEYKTTHVNFTSQDAKAKMELTWNGVSIQNNSDVTIDAGRNTLEVKVTAQDQVTTRIYRYTIISLTKQNPSISKIQVGSKQVPLSDNTKEYVISTKEQAPVVDVEGSNVSLVLNEESIKNKTALKLLPGKNVLYVMATSKTSKQPLRYQVVIKVDNEQDATLDSVTFDEFVQVDQEFDANVKKYQGNAHKSKVAMHVKLSNPQASFTIRVNGKKVKDSMLHLRDGMNTIEIQVTSKDQSVTNTYTYQINAHDVVYLSDLTMMSGSQNGWEAFEQDQNHAKKPLTLVSTDVFTLQELQPKVFKKGVWSHADSVMHYDLTDKGYTAFETYVGVEFTQHASDAASVKIKVSIDGKVVKESSVLRGYHGPLFIQVPIQKGDKKLTLEAFKVDNNSCDHVAWGDAKFIKPLTNPAKPCTHSKTTIENKVAATCEQEGYSGDVVCTECDEVVTKGTILIALGHKETIKNKVDATCGSDGYTGDKVCSRCNKELEKGIVVSKTNQHTFGEWEVVLAPTTTSEGKKQRQCSGCNHVETKTIAKLESSTTVVDKTKLKQCLTTANTLVQKEYTQSSWNVFALAKTKADQVYANAKATQKEVDDAYSVLQQAMNQLIKVQPQQEIKPEGNKDETGTGDVTSLSWFVSSLTASGVIVASMLKRRKQ